MEKLIITISLLLAFNFANAQWKEQNDGSMVFFSSYNYNSITRESNFNAPIEFYLKNGDLKVVYVNGKTESFYPVKSRSNTTGYNEEGKYYMIYKFVSYRDGRSILFQMFRHTSESGDQVVRMLYSNGYMEYHE